MARMSRFSPAVALTFRPGSLAVPFALLVMQAVSRALMTMVPAASASSRLIR